MLEKATQINADELLTSLQSYNQNKEDKQKDTEDSEDYIR